MTNDATDLLFFVSTVWQWNSSLTEPHKSTCLVHQVNTAEGNSVHTRIIKKKDLMAIFCLTIGGIFCLLVDINMHFWTAVKTV